MKVLITGASGYLGNVIRENLPENDVFTLARKNADYIYDLALRVPSFQQSFDLVIHSAGLAHQMQRDVSSEGRFFDVNVKGTSNLLKGLEGNFKTKRFVFISSVAVYGMENGVGITEENELLANDPYGKSKIIAESLVSDWCKANNVKFAILRLPLVAGSNPPGNLKSMIAGIEKGYYFNIAGGHAKKSMVLASDVARIIPHAANIGGIYNLGDGYHPSFNELSCLIAHELNRPKPLNMPYWLAKVFAQIGDMVGDWSPLNSLKLQKITSTLTFDDSKARKRLNWKPDPVLNGFKIKKS